MMNTQHPQQTMAGEVLQDAEPAQRRLAVLLQNVEPLVLAEVATAERAAASLALGNS